MQRRKGKLTSDIMALQLYFLEVYEVKRARRLHSHTLDRVPRATTARAHTTRPKTSRPGNLPPTQAQSRSRDTSMHAASSAAPGRGGATTLVSRDALSELDAMSTTYADRDRSRPLVVSEKNRHKECSFNDVNTTLSCLCVCCAAWRLTKPTPVLVFYLDVQER